MTDVYHIGHIYSKWTSGTSTNRPMEQKSETGPRGTQRSITIQWGKSGLQKVILDAVDIHMENQKKYDLYRIPYTKINSRWTVILKVQSIIERLENTTEQLHHLKLGKDLLKENKSRKSKVRFLNQTSLKWRLSFHHKTPLGSEKASHRPRENS